MLSAVTKATLNTKLILLYAVMLPVSILLSIMVTTDAEASYIPAGGIDGGTYTTFSTPTAWDPGANTARVGGFPAEGGATWSIMGAGLNDVSGFDLHGISVTSDITSLGFSQGAIENMINTAMDAWANVSGFTNLGQVVDGGVGFGDSELNGGHLGDIRIGAISFDGPGNILAHGYQPGTESIFGFGGTIAGDIHIDNDENWGNTFDLATVILHEVGHSLGLGHSLDPAAIMFPEYSGVKLTLRADDIAGIQAIYGTAAVPLPGAVFLFLSGIGVLGFFRQRYS